MYWYSYNYPSFQYDTSESDLKLQLGWPLELGLISISSSRWLDHSGPGEIERTYFICPAWACVHAPLTCRTSRQTKLKSYLMVMRASDGLECNGSKFIGNPFLPLFAHLISIEESPVAVISGKLYYRIEIRAFESIRCCEIARLLISNLYLRLTLWILSDVFRSPTGSWSWCMIVD